MGITYFYETTFKEIRGRMNMTGYLMKSQRLIGIFLFGCLLFTFPILSLFDSNRMVLGIPLLYVFLFTAWLILIVLMAIAVKR